MWDWNKHKRTLFKNILQSSTLAEKIRLIMPSICICSERAIKLLHNSVQVLCNAGRGTAVAVSGSRTTETRTTLILALLLRGCSGHCWCLAGVATAEITTACVSTYAQRKRNIIVKCSFYFIWCWNTRGLEMNYVYSIVLFSDDLWKLKVTLTIYKNWFILIIWM